MLLRRQIPSNRKNDDKECYQQQDPSTFTKIVERIGLYPVVSMKIYAICQIRQIHWFNFIALIPPGTLTK